MSYSWRLSRGSVGQDRHSIQNEKLGSAAVETPLTPPSVRNVSPSICLNMVQFRALMQEYRSLDDSVTTRLNRTLANTRSSGLNSSPSILSGHVPSNSSLDLGKSTYAIAPEQACLQFWHELVNVWIGREEVLKYCLQVEERNRLQQIAPIGTSVAGSGKEEWLLDNDVERERRRNNLPASAQAPQKKSKYDAFDSRASRTEDSAETLRRQMKNELSVEAIIRKRSLDVFKSRCRFFTPTFSEGVRGEQERAMWEGKDTKAGEQARR